jgi:hypothetical protein
MKNVFRFLILLVPFFSNTNISMSQWVRTSCPYGDIVCLAVSDTTLFAVARWTLLDTTVYRVVTTGDNGATWQNADSGLRTGYITSIAASSSDIFLGTGDRGVYRSSNNGKSWTAVDSGLTNPYITSLAVSDSNIIVATWGGGLFLSRNNGTIWTQLGSDKAPSEVWAIAVIGTDVFAGMSVNGVYRSTINGTKWIEANSGLTSKLVSSLAVIGTSLFAGTIGGGVFLSTDNGVNWTNVGLASNSIATLGVIGSNLFASSESEPFGVYLSADIGRTWSKIDTGLSGGYVLSFAVSKTHLFAAEGGVFRRPLPEIITSVNAASRDIPVQFTLGQNYPNPFNPTTSIAFILTSRSLATLEIFDLIGRRVAILVNDVLPMGNHTYQWNAESASTGVFFYRLHAGSFTETKKLVLIK